MAKPYGLLDQNEFNALMDKAHEARGGVRMSHIKQLIAAIRTLFTSR